MSEPHEPAEGEPTGHAPAGDAPATDGAAPEAPASAEHAAGEPADRLAGLRRDLAALDEAPLSAHPEVLERTHRALVEELEALEHLDDDEAAS